MISEKERKTHHAWVLLSFVIAHRSARKQVTQLLQATDEDQATELMSKVCVLRSSAESIEEAVEQLQKMGETFVNDVKVWQVTGMVFNEQRRMIERSRDSGLLDDTQAHELLHELEHDEEHSYWKPMQLEHSMCSMQAEDTTDTTLPERAITR